MPARVCVVELSLYKSAGEIFSSVISQKKEKIVPGNIFLLF